ncbi:hypothetical protein [Actinocrinis sp.]|uniref:hypothetical protein n=1 Tax=Actinocrinis sp. TaxID=1920516 RepID=UPI002D30C936|nr:hypothetical protein [Actinocrinis sp.]HZP52367.1 hypothetical protein [Actinocrinis sp.]
MPIGLRADIPAGLLISAVRVPGAARGRGAPGKLHAAVTVSAAPARVCGFTFSAWLIGPVPG